MFHYSPAYQLVRVIGIDPGTVTLGIACLDIDVMTRRVELVDARTIDAGRAIRDFQLTSRYHGLRFARLMALEESIYNYLRAFNPHIVASESPYMGRFPQAYAALVECMNSIERAQNRYTPYAMLHRVDPMSVKLAVGVESKGKSKKERSASLSKDHVREGLMRQPIAVPPGYSFQVLDEHAVDATAVAYAIALQVLG